MYISLCDISYVWLECTQRKIWKSINSFFVHENHLKIKLCNQQRKWKKCRATSFVYVGIIISRI